MMDISTIHALNKFVTEQYCEEKYYYNVSMEIGDEYSTDGILK